MEIITPFEIYLVCQLDSAVKLFMGLAIASGIIGAVALIFTIAHFVEEEEPPPSLIKWAKGLVAMSLLCMLLATFTPSSKTVAMMKVIPAIANNEDVQGECKELYTLAKQGLKELITTDKEKD